MVFCTRIDVRDAKSRFTYAIFEGEEINDDNLIKDGDLQPDKDGFFYIDVEAAPHRILICFDHKERRMLTCDVPIKCPRDGCTCKKIRMRPNVSDF